jgi:transcriptional regulator with XRE-family HTH domain
MQTRQIYRRNPMPRRSTPNSLAEGIGLRIAELRREQGLTAEKLAYESDVGSKGYVSDIEHGLALPSLTTLDRIARRLDVSLYDLLVLPTRGDRERLIDLTRHVPKGPLTRLLRELVAAQPAIPPWVPPRLHAVRGYATLEVAAGWSTPALPRGEVTAETVRLPGNFKRGRDFAVRAAGHSMQGFRSTIRDGDWLIMRKGELSPDSALGQVVLMAREDRFGDKSLHVKRVVKKAQKIWFRSDDSDIKPLPATELDQIIASLVSVVQPESLAPPVHTHSQKGRVCKLFGITHEPSGPWSRVDGHLFFQVKATSIKPRGVLTVTGCAPRPAETAYVLAASPGAVEYLGLARFDHDEGQWRLAQNLARTET